MLTNGTLMRTEIDGSVVPGLAESIRYTPDFRAATVIFHSNVIRGQLSLSCDAILSLRR